MFMYIIIFLYYNYSIFSKLGMYLNNFTFAKDLKYAMKMYVDTSIELKVLYNIDKYITIMTTKCGKTYII